MANEHFASTILVEVGGSPLPDDVAALLTLAYVDDSRHVPDMFVLRFRDPGRIVLDKGRFTIGTAVRLRVQTSDPGGPALLMAGEVTAVELDLDASGTVTEVRGLDRAHRLCRGRRVCAYPNMTVPDVVRRVAERAGLKTGQIDAAPGVAGAQHTQLSQDGVSDWEFLCRLADLVGAEVAVVDGALDFRLPKPPSEAPDTSAESTRDELVLEADRNLLSLRASVTAADQVPEVTVRGWDAARKQAVTASATPTVPGTEAPPKPTDLAGTVGSPAFAVADPTLSTDAAVKAVAGALAARLGGGCVELEGVARGNPKLRAGAAVALTNVGDPFQGRYTLTTTRHLFTAEDGYTTAFAVSGRSERSLYGLAAGGRRTGETRPGRDLVPAIVSDVKDPDKLGRVRLTMPWLDGEFTTGWARVAQPGAGKGRGAVLLPEVGDEVLVGFASGDLDAPFVLGGLWSTPDPAPTLGCEPIDANSGEVTVRALVSRTGHRLELAEAANGPDGILLSTGDGKLLLRLDEKGRLVELTSAGKIKVTAKEGVSVDAGSGPLELSGQRVAIKAQQDVTVNANGQLDLAGTRGASLKGGQVSVAGQSTAEVTASGTLTVRGGMVRIN